MRREKVVGLLESTGIPVESERAVPIDGAAKRLPYMVIRSSEKDEKAPGGRVGVMVINWRVSLFTVNKDFALECKIRKALAELPNVEVERLPDGQPYQTDFVFASKEGKDYA